MTAIFARSPLQSLPMATNRPTTRRRSVKQAFEEDDAPAPKRPRIDANGTTKKTNGVTKKTTKTVFDENDDGFQFTRRASRRTTKAQPAAEPIPENEVLKPAPAPARKKKLPVPAPEPEKSVVQKRRRSARLSSDMGGNQIDGPADREEPKTLPRRTKKAGPPAEKEKKKSTAHTPKALPEEKSAQLGVKTPTHNKGRDGGATKIMLPFADTPVITRNKEMRKGNKDGHRRSSTGLRGRRASSLIESGMSNALPHSEVEIRDFYKYIEQSLPEPRRMKQLLTWCGSRALPEKPTGDVKNVNAIMAARAIQQELIDDFANKPELSNWFSREDTVAPTVIKKPNPQNEKNQNTLQELEDEIKRLEEQKSAWDSLASSSKPAPSAQTPSIQTTSFTDIDTSLLGPAQAAIISSLNVTQPASSTDVNTGASSSTSATNSGFTFTFTTPAALQSHLEKLSQSLEPNIDLFADGLHKVEQYRNTAERVADRILSTASKKLEERDKACKEKVGSEGIGVGDVLRGLAGVLNDSS